MPAAERDRSLKEMLHWARATHEKKPAAFAHFRTTEIADHYTFGIRGQRYTIDVVRSGRRSHTIRAVGDHRLVIEANPDDGHYQSGQLFPKLLAKHFGARFLPEVAARVHGLNELHFRRPIGAVKLSDTYSRWGSCSTKGNINLSTRLLLAPAEVLDAVIIHELAHLVEANHSPRFWAQVRRALPEYLEYDAWLGDHGKDLHFRPVPIGG